jgi:hypothetical protein
VRRLALLVLVSAACGQPAPPQPVVAPANAAAAGCADVLAGFAPGGRVVIESIALEMPPPSARAEEEGAFPCALDESDDACLHRAEEAFVAGTPGAVVHGVELAGEPAGFEGTIEIDGRLHPIAVATDAEVSVEARRLQAAGHQIVLRELHRVYRRETRQAVLRWSPPPDAPAEPTWQARIALHADGEGEAALASALASVQAEAARLDLAIIRWQRVDVRTASMVLACPRP